MAARTHQKRGTKWTQRCRINQNCLKIPCKWLLRREDDTTANCHMRLSKLIMDFWDIHSLSCEGSGCVRNYRDRSLTHIILLSMSFPLVANRLSVALWYSRCQRRIKNHNNCTNKGTKDGDTCFWALHINLICAADNDANVLGREAARSVPKHTHTTVSKMAGNRSSRIPSPGHMPQQAEQPNETILRLGRILEAPDMEKGPKQARWYF